MFKKELLWSIWIVACGSECAPKMSPTAALKKAIMLAESSGDPYAIGDRHLTHKAYGPLQVRQPLVDDLNRLYAQEIRRKFGKKKLRAQDFLGNVALSYWAFDRYIACYATRRRLGREPTDEDRARIWNGGPDAWRNNNSRLSRNAKRYWENCVKPRLLLGRKK